MTEQEGVLMELVGLQVIMSVRNATKCKVRGCGSE